MPITITAEARQQLLASIKRYVFENLEQDLGDLKAGLLLDYVLKEVGPTIYNKAIEDAQAYFQARTMDLAYLLLDSIAQAMIGTPDSDDVHADLHSGLQRLGFDARRDDAETWKGDPRVVREWRVQRAAYVQREEELKREILLARGERQMVMEMEASEGEFRERVEGARREWRVEV